jgi:hypothetical protein
MSSSGRQAETGGEANTVDASHTGIPVKEKHEKSALSIPKSRSWHIYVAAVCLSAAVASTIAVDLVVKLLTKSE